MWQNIALCYLNHFLQLCTVHLVNNKNINDNIIIWLKTLDRAEQNVLLYDWRGPAIVDDVLVSVRHHIYCIWGLRVVSSLQHIVWRYIVMLISCVFQNIVEISLSHFFWTISHDIYLISTHTESPYRWLKVPIGEAIFRWKWHKMSKYTPYKWSLTGKDRFPKKYNLRAFLPIVASRRNTLLEKNAIFDAFKISCISCDNRIKTQNIV